MGANPNSSNRHGLTSLSYAARRPGSELVALLLQNGADPNRGNALLKAIEYNNPAAVRELLQAGASVRARTTSGQSLLEVALGGHRNPAIIEALFQFGAPISPSLTRNSNVHQQLRPLIMKQLNGPSSISEQPR